MATPGEASFRRGKQRESGESLQETLLAIGRDCARWLKEPFLSIDHGEMLYDELGLPK